MLQAIYQGFINSSGNIFLIFFCGASVAMVEESHALSDFFTWLARKLKGKEMFAIALLMYGLGLGNAAGAEDFAFIKEKKPGIFVRLGARTPGGPYGSAHSPTFYCDNACIPVGMLTIIGLAADYLGFEI